MLREKYISYYLTNIFLDALIAIMSLLAAYLVRAVLFEISLNFDVPFIIIPEMYTFAHFSWLLLVMIPLWPILMDMNGAYASLQFINSKRVIWIIFKSVSQATALLILFMFIFKIERVSRIFIFLIAIISFFLLVLKEYLLRIYLLSQKRSEVAFRNILIVARGEECRKIIELFNQFWFWGLRIFGIVTTSQSTRSKDEIAGIKVIGNLNDIPDILVKHPIDEVLFTDTTVDPDRMHDILEECEELGIKTRIPLNQYDLKIAKLSVENFQNIPILTFSTTSAKVLDLFFKYLLDRILAFFILIILSPVMFLIGLIIKLTSKGPILFSQIRTGLYGRPFVFYKFRSMYIDAEDRLKELEKFNEMQGPVFKMKNDPRVTPFGRFIRRTSLDELPQLFNVLKGEMSLVGPRPPLPKEVEQYQRWQRRKLSMKPGITCIWQISGRNEIVDFDNWMRMDLEYIDNWSLWLDFRILVKTLFVVLTMYGAR